MYINRMEAQKFALLLCCEDTDYIKRSYNGYYGVFTSMLKEEGETWDTYNVSKLEFPADSDLGGYDGFVISGSCSDAHSNDLWILKLVNLLQKLVTMKKRILGICFGHQILGRAVGGKTGRADTGWEIGVMEIHLQNSKIFTSLNLPASLRLIQCHRDEIKELPAKAEILASSDKIGIEMFRYEDHIMGIQGHPEYTQDILFHLIDKLSTRNDIEKYHAEDLKSKLEDTETDREAWKKLCTNFLKGRV